MQVPSAVAALSARLNDIGFERTRRAVAALALSVFFSLYLLLSLNAPEGFGRVFVALALCYGVAFVAVVAEWFWGRWFATGLAWSGLMIAIFALVTLGWVPALVIFGAVHLLVVLSLMGKKMAVRYDLQEAWRARYKMDEFGVARLQKTVTRTAATLPSMIIWALAPKEEGMAALGALGALVLVVVGLRGVVRLRSWGVLALGGAAATAGAAAVFGPSLGRVAASSDMGALAHLSAVAGAPLAIVLLTAAVLPFAGSVARYLRRPA
jgi:hypothetical protein